MALSLGPVLGPSQYDENTRIIFGALGLSQRLLDGHAVLVSWRRVRDFLVLSGVVYLLNDIADREADRKHPVKRFRPIASGALPVPVATGWAVGLGLGALAAAFWLRPLFGVVATSYLVLLALYSWQLKHIVILDVLTIAIGFVMRAAAGAVALAVPISHWLYVLTILLALFLAFSKRRHELVLLADGATSHRRILAEYQPVSARPDDCRRVGVDHRCVCVLYGQS